MAILVKFLAAGCAGILLGLFLTFLTVERGIGFGAVAVGAWTAWPQNGMADIDPYGRARLARSGELPVGATEGLSFVARGDDMGAAFDPSCDYILKGNVPRARYWTLALLSPEGFPVANIAQRHGFTSSEILRAADGTFEIQLSARARAGNWLPIGKAERFILVLRLYDTELDAGATGLSPADLPHLVGGRCR